MKVVSGPLFKIGSSCRLPRGHLTKIYRGNTVMVMTNVIAM